MSQNRIGYDERVNVGRASPKRLDFDLDNEPSTMVQEQIARLKFFVQHFSISGKRVLELGCGTGFNCEYLKNKLEVAEVVGIDISESALAFARKNYPTIQFKKGDICSSDLEVDHNAWDAVICCEVIEHVPDPHKLLDSIYRHLRTGGFAFVTTPNRPVFSLGHEPSPVNHTHIKEFNLVEFKDMLEAKFSSVEIWGQRFTTSRLFEMHQAILRRNIRDIGILGDLYWNIPIRQGWKVLRLEPLLRWIGGGLSYNHQDFSLIQPVSKDSIWLCALVGK